MTELISVQNNKYFMSQFLQIIFNLYFRSTDFHFYSKNTIINSKLHKGSNTF